MRISVIIASYDRPKLLENCLRSLEKQRRKPDEVIIALQREDWSSLKFLKENEGKFDLHLYMTLSIEKGEVAQDNVALLQACGDIVCFIDDDAKARQDWLQKIEKWYRKEGVIGGVGGRDIVHQIDGSIDERPVNTVGKITWFGRSIGNHHNIVGQWKKVDFLKGCNMSYKRELLRKIDENLLGQTVPFREEWIGFNVRNKGYSLIYDPQITVDHFPAPARKNLQDLRVWNERTAFIRGHNHTYTVLCNFSFLKKICFLCYVFGIGDYLTPGPGRIVISFLKGDFGKTKGLLHSSIRGKAKGLLSYHSLLWRTFESARAP